MALKAGPSSSETAVTTALRTHVKASLDKASEEGRVALAKCLVSLNKTLDQQAENLQCELIEVEEKLPAHLEVLRENRCELLRLREEVLSATAQATEIAQKVGDALKVNAPELLARISALGSKQAQLRQLRFRSTVENLSRNAHEALEDDVDIRSLLGALTELKSVLETHSDLEEATLEEGKRKVEMLRSKLLEELDTNIVKKLESLGFPFEEQLDTKRFASELRDARKLFDAAAVLHETNEEFEGWAARRLSDPFERRFHYHFESDRPTNDPQHPEWFFQQVLRWLLANVPMVSEIVASPIADAFIARLVELLKSKTDKFTHNSQVLESPSLLARLVDEAVEFAIQADAWKGSVVLEPLCEPKLLERWLRTETVACAAELDAQFTSGGGWRGRWHGQSAADAWAVPECADRLIVALECHRERAKHLPVREARRAFDAATLEIVDDFRRRLIHVSLQATSPWTEPYPQLMNALWYVAHALEEWADEAAIESTIEHLEGGRQDEGDESVEKRFESSVRRKALIGAAEMYRHVWQQKAGDLVDSLKALVSPHVSLYQKQRWLEPGSVGGKKERELSAAFCPLLMRVRTSLGQLSPNVGAASFGRLHTMLVKALANLISKDVVEKTAFSADGAAQMLFDIQQGLLPVLDSQWARNATDLPAGAIISGVAEKTAAETESAMAKLLGALKVLALPLPTAILLREELVRSPAELMNDRLAEMGLKNVDKDMVIALFRQRTDLGQDEADTLLRFK